MSFKLFIPALIFISSGCAVFYSKPNTLSQSQKKQFSVNHENRNNYLINGRIMFKNPEGSYSGDMAIRILNNSDFELSVFAPLVGTLIYSLRANSNNLLINNFQDQYYILNDNTYKVRKTWLGIDISLSELKWLILGRIPIQKSIWIHKKKSKNQYLMFKGSIKLIFSLNSNGRIKSLEKFIDGFPEYRAEILNYKKFSQTFFPRKITIKDASKIYQWKILISEIKKSTKSYMPLDLNPPKNLKKIEESQ